MRKIFFYLALLLALPPAYAQEAARDINWDQQKDLLAYTLPVDTVVKARVGSANGPIYQTIVNMENRKAGKYVEPFNGKDPAGKITYTDFGPLHFCVDARPGAKKDLILLVYPGGQDAKTKPVALGSTLPVQMLGSQDAVSLTLDIADIDKPWFSKQGVEIMIFVDNKMSGIQQANNLPAAVKVSTRLLVGPKHLISFNVWTRDHASVACKNLLLESSAQAIQSPKEPPKPPKPLALKDGKLAYCQRVNGFWQVFISELDGSKPRQLTRDQGDKRYPAISPDGKRLAFVTNTGELWIMELDKNRSSRLPLEIAASQPVFSSDGKRIMFVSYQDLYHGDSELWEVETAGNKLKKIMSRPWMQYDPVYSPDASKILFTDGPELYAQDIYRLEFKTGSALQVTENGPYDFDMQADYSLDGESIVYVSNECQNNYDIWLSDKFGMNKKNLTKNGVYNTHPHFTKDNNYVYYLSDKSGHQEVWRMIPNGSKQEQVTQDGNDKHDLTIWTIVG